MPTNIIPGLNVRQLRAVVAVADYRSFIAAASYLGVTQPALTRIIQQVEQILGVELFSRTTRQIAVTPAGREFSALAERVLNDLKLGFENLQKYNEAPRGQIVVSSVLSLAGAVMPGLIADYNRTFPGVEIQLREGIQNDVVDDVQSGVADFAVGYIEKVPKTFIVERLRPEPLQVVLRADDPLANKSTLRIKDLADVPLVSFAAASRSRRLVDNIAALQGTPLRYVVVANRLATLLELVRNKVGLTVLPASECPEKSDIDLVTVPLREKTADGELGILGLRDHNLSDPAMQFRLIVRNWIIDGSKA